MGKVRHPHVADLWIQEKRTSGEIRYNKVLGTEGCADVMAKGVEADTHCKFMGLRPETVETHWHHCLGGAPLDKSRVWAAKERGPGKGQNT